MRVYMCVCAYVCTIQTCQSDVCVAWVWENVPMCVCTRVYVRICMFAFVYYSRERQIEIEREGGREDLPRNK